MRTLPSGHAKRALAGQLLLALRAFSSIAQAFSLAWAFVESNFFTFAVPNTVFGLLGALAGPRLLEGPVLIFDLANQYPPQSVAEDRANKPWRPLPAGRLTSDQARRLTLLAASAGLVFNYGLGLWSEGLLVQVLSYYYNELEGSGGLLRDAIIAVSYGLANRASLKLAAGPENRVSPAGHAWTAVVSGVVLTTMHVQDIKDQRGDRMRGRKTLPLLLGDGRCRVALAVLVPSWSLVNVGFWRLGLVASASYCLLAAWIAQRVLTKREAQEDARTWRIWCFWLASLYAFPLFGAP
ncbi:UbiA prenyltransferase family-domain-containing protein [Apiospora saccharicola]|uniref:UbiA prenyltransferase family-domain-containing protein n=1 Tax=Apiospora saccharicola TaxID=335842 RepID=A0ABR1U5U9_9PEZI